MNIICSVVATKASVRPVLVSPKINLELVWLVISEFGLAGLMKQFSSAILCVKAFTGKPSAFLIMIEM